MHFHHIGVATKDIQKSFTFLEKNFNVIGHTEIIDDPLQEASLMMVQTDSLDIELVSGKVVEKLIEKKISYYHMCYEVDNIEIAIENFSEAIVVSPPKPAILFDNRKVAFLHTPLGLIELLE